MLFSGNNPILQIRSVDHTHSSGGSFDVAPREYCSLSYRIHGSAVIKSEGREYFVNSNDVLYMPQGTGYHADYTDHEMIFVDFITQQSDGEIAVFSLKNSEQVYKTFLQLLSLWARKKPGFTIHSMARLYSLVGTIFEKQTAPLLPPHFLGALSYINSDYKNASLTIGEICRHAGISATAFRQLFQKYYQKTPLEYITELRLENARNLIAGGASVENAALESGFNDPKYFARVVKRRLACTPRELKTYGK